jgi:hypothetical protein
MIVPARVDSPDGPLSVCTGLEDIRTEIAEMCALLKIAFSVSGQPLAAGPCAR